MSSIADRIEVRQGYEGIIDRYSWDLFATGTFSYEVTKKEAVYKVKKYFKNTESRLRSPLPRFWVLEPHKNINSYHVHFLLCGVKNINENVPQILFNQWRKISGRGRFRSDKYDPSRNVSSYLSKYLTKDIAYYDFDKLDCVDFRYQQYGALSLAEAIEETQEES